MLRLLLLNCLLILSFSSFAKTILVKNGEELANANKNAKPGDIIILKNGEWNQVTISLNCNGTKEMPVTFKAETGGKVIITGNSKLKIGGSHIIVDGLYFTNGYAGKNAIISFRTTTTETANNCRVTNTVINNFNNPKRLDENYWIEFYGKNNRLDHCSFLNKKNMGVLLAVILDDERSRENFHSIDHNYFGVRLPLASNSGEIIRVGVSQHCEFNSNTQITDNFFEHCDGETEIVSIKSGSNTIRNNVFKECQGSLVLRHGDFNTVENNIFLGNNKEGTGGVRIINKGQWVVNNLFYKCRGVGFRSPLSIMNGVPNSPAFRYVAVTDAVIANNSFIECTPASFCEGSDTERTVQPQNVEFINNIFYNTTGKILYNSYDDISGIRFSGNRVSKSFEQSMENGFTKSSFTLQKINNLILPIAGTETNSIFSDSIQAAGKSRLKSRLSSSAGITDKNLFEQIENNAYSACGAKWFAKSLAAKIKKEIKIDCNSVADIIKQLQKNTESRMIINLTAKEYYFTEPLLLNKDIAFTSVQKNKISFIKDGSSSDYLFMIVAGNTLQMNNLALDLTDLNTHSFISTDTSGSSNHCNLLLQNSSFNKLNGTFLSASKTNVSDSIIISNCSFSNITGTLLKFDAELDKKGYYNVEKIRITNTNFVNHKGQILTMLRGGNDESTMGPLLVFSKNKITKSNTGNAAVPLILLIGIQKTIVTQNVFQNSNEGKTVIVYKDDVRAVHIYGKNQLLSSGIVIPDKFVEFEAGNNK